MKKLTKKSLDELAAIMPVLQEIELLRFVGGGKDSCVFNCFDYLDSGLHTASYYYEQTSGTLGYVPDANGNVRTSDIERIGHFGGFDVEALTGNFSLDASGLINGNPVIMTFNINNNGKQEGHAVVVEGYQRDANGNLEIKYYDPTTVAVAQLPFSGKIREKLKNLVSKQAI